MIHAGVGSVMCSYNQVNNSQACQNSYVLNNVLKEQLGFPGFVMSDWSALHSGVASVLAGADMSMPGRKLEFLHSQLHIFEPDSLRQNCPIGPTYSLQGRAFGVCSSFIHSLSLPAPRLPVARFARVFV